MLQAIVVLRNLPRQYEGGFCSSGLVNVEAADDQIRHRGTCHQLIQSDGYIYRVAPHLHEASLGRSSWSVP